MTEQKKKCVAEGCEEGPLWGSEFCWGHLVERGEEAVNEWRKKVLENNQNLAGANLSGADFSEKTFEALRKEGFWHDFREVNLKYANLFATNLQGARLEDADLEGANLQRVNLKGARLCGANLQGALIIHGANLQNCNLERAYLSGASLNSANLEKAELANADLQGAELHMTNLQEARLYNTNLQGTRLNLANFQGASLVATDLQGATLLYTNLQGASMKSSKLQGAYIFHANFRGTNLSESNLKDAELTNIGYTEFLRLPLCAKNLIARLKLDTKVNWKWVKNFYERINSPTLWKGAMVDAVGKCDPLVLKYIKDQSWLEAKLEDSKKSRWSRFWMFLWGITCGYGSNIWLWIFWSWFIAFIYGLTYWLAGDSLVKIVVNLPGNPGWFKYFYFSIVTFTTLGFGDVVPVSGLGEFIVATEVILGYVMLGGLISIFTNKLARLS